MSDHNSDDLNAKPAGPAADHPDASAQPPKQQSTGAQDAAKLESPGVVPDQGQPSETPKVQATSAADAAAPRSTGRIMVMSPSRHDGWNGSTIDDEQASAHGAPKSSVFGKRRASALAAILVLATTAGVIGGSLATAGLGHFFASNSTKAASNQSHALEDSIRQIGADVAALKSSVERSSKQDSAQFSKVNDRIEKIEKAQIEPAAKLAKISETLEKLRVASVAPAAATPAAAKEITGSIPTPVPAPNKADVNRLPTIDGWRVRDVANGGALVEGRDGLYEVYAGDPLPGLGRVDAIRRQDGRWVVVTSRGLIVAR